MCIQKAQIIVSSCGLLFTKKIISLNIIEKLVEVEATCVLNDILCQLLGNSCKNPLN